MTKENKIVAGVTITLLVIAYSVTMTYTFPFRNPDRKVGVKKSSFVFIAASAGVPIGKTNNTTTPEIKASSLHSMLSNVSYLDTQQQVFCLFEILFIKEVMLSPFTGATITLHNYLLTLFRTLISTNAP